MTEVAGVKLVSLVEPVHDAITSYQRLSRGNLLFDPARASVLEATPERANSARSVSEVKDFTGEHFGELVVIAFKPEDGSGNDLTFRVDDLDFEFGIPHEVKAVPRSKDGTHTEVYLPILRQRVEEPNAHPHLFYGSLDLLGIERGGQKPRVAKLGEIGFREWADSVGVHAVYTTGYRYNTLDARERFGDPHAVFNSMPNYLVIGAFLALSEELVAKDPSKLDSLASLHPLEPRWTKFREPSLDPS